MKKFSNGPQVGVEVFTSKGAVSGSRLFLSDSFCLIGGDRRLCEWLDAYTQGIALPLDWISGTPFQQKVMLAMQKIPFGKTMSYKELAALAESPQGARAIGNACNKNPFPLFVPCHRVVYTNGSIGGFAYGLEMKRRLLAFEAGKRSCPTCMN